MCVRECIHGQAGWNVLSVCVCVSARVGDGLSSSCRRQRQRSLTKFRVRRLLRPRKVARQASGGEQAGRQTGSGTPWQEITYLHGALWSVGGGAGPGRVVWLTSQQKLRNRIGAARNQREREGRSAWSLGHFAL